MTDRKEAEGDIILEDMLQYIKPEFAVLVAALYFLGAAFKKSRRISDNWIPLLLTVCGTVIAGLFVLGHSADYLNIAAGVFEAVTQGAVCAGMSVYINQLIKQCGNGCK